MRDLTNGAIVSGSILSEKTLAEQYEVSRTPVREALVRLASEGFLRKGAYRSYVVADVSLEIFRDLFQIRILLEPTAASFATRNPMVSFHRASQEDSNRVQRSEQACERGRPGVEVRKT